MNGRARASRGAWRDGAAAIIVTSPCPRSAVRRRAPSPTKRLLPLRGVRTDEDPDALPHLRNLRPCRPRLAFAVLGATSAAAQMAKLPAAPPAAPPPRLGAAASVHGGAVRQGAGRHRDDSGYAGATKVNPHLRRRVERQHRSRRLKRRPGAHDPVAAVKSLDIFCTTSIRRSATAVLRCRGTQYRTAIFVKTDEERRAAEASGGVSRSPSCSRMRSTPVVTLTEFRAGGGIPPDHYRKNSPASPTIGRAGAQHARLKQPQQKVAGHRMMEMKTPVRRQPARRRLRSRPARARRAMTSGTFGYGGVTADTLRRLRRETSSPWSFFRDNIEEEYPAKRVR